jgi:hypothetical protein
VRSLAHLTTAVAAAVLVAGVIVTGSGRHAGDPHHRDVIPFLEAAVPRPGLLPESLPTRRCASRRTLTSE